MAHAVAISDLARFAGQEVKLSGWLYNRRSKGKIHFLQVRDGSGFVQAVMSRADSDDEQFELAGRTAQEASIVVRGNVHADARAPGGYELHVTHFELLAAPKREYPIAIQEFTPNVDKLLGMRHLWLRSKRPHAALRVRHIVIQAIRNFFDGEGFICVDTPIFTPAACEGTTTLFEVPYFELGEAYLTQSGQLYAEAAAMAFGKVYCFGPTFRAERSKTRRHLTEFWMVEPEVAFADLDAIVDLAEGLLQAVVRAVLDRCQPELETLGRDPAPLRPTAERGIVRMTYAEACAAIVARAHELADSEDEEERRLSADAMTAPGGDFGAADETILGALHDRPIAVTDWPAAIKAFYMKRTDADAEVARCVDVIAPEGYGELIGGSQREDDLDALEQRIAEHGLPAEAFSWYTDLRRYGSVPHSGFGLGLERTVAWLCGVAHIRECIPFPRTPYRITP